MEKITISKETFDNLTECANALHALLHEITIKPQYDGNPFSNPPVKNALKTLAKYRGIDNFLNAAD